MLEKAKREVNRLNRRKFMGASSAAFVLWNLPGGIMRGREGSGGIPPFPGGAGQTASHTFGYKGEHFLLDGEPFLLISGEMHYPACQGLTGVTACTRCARWA